MTKRPREEPPKRVKGGQKGNRSALRHGLTASKLPQGAQYLENRINAFRRQLEDLVIEAKGEISLSDAASIQTAVKWERHAGLAERWLRLEGNTMKPADRLNFSREIAKASTERDKALRLLDLDRDTRQDALTLLYSPNTADDESDNESDTDEGKEE